MRFRVVVAMFTTLAVAGAMGAGVRATGPHTPPPAAGRLGDVEFVNAYQQNDHVTHGSQDTIFSLKVPSGATCPGDSANDDWRVDSFFIPSGRDPLSLLFGAVGPVPDGDDQHPMRDVSGAAFTATFTDANDSPGLPGVISQAPPLSFQWVAVRRIPSGTYLVGIACNFWGSTTQYWDASVIIDDSLQGPVGQPVTGGSFKWRLASQPLRAAQPDGRNRWLVLLVATASLSLLAVGIRRVRTFRSHPSSRALIKEST